MADERHRHPSMPIDERGSLRARESREGRADEMNDDQEVALRAVNDDFERMLLAVPEIDAYLADLAARAP